MAGLKKGKAQGKGLSPKQRLFVKEYPTDLNATKAAIRAGYSEKTAYRIGATLVQKSSVAEALQKAMDKRAVKAEIDAQKVLEQYIRFAFYDPRALFNPDGSLKAMSEWPDDVAAAINGIEIVEMPGDSGSRIHKLKMVDKRGALADIAKHLSMFKEIIKGEISGALEISWAE